MAKRCPTDEEIKTHARIEVEPGVFGFAAWYPQMGGYVGKCIVIPQGGCFDVYIWHDGDFPFKGRESAAALRTMMYGDEQDDHGSPAFLHHCSTRQFVDFAEWVDGLPGMDEREKARNGEGEDVQ